MSQYDMYNLADVPYPVLVKVVGFYQNQLEVLMPRYSPFEIFRVNKIDEGKNWIGDTYMAEANIKNPDPEQVKVVLLKRPGKYLVWEL